MEDSTEYIKPIQREGNIKGYVVNKITFASEGRDSNLVQKVADMSSSNTVPAAEQPLSAEEAEAYRLLGSYITKEYELLHLVLSHLPIADLNAASLVCRTWSSAAAAVRRSRIKPHWLLWQSNPQSIRARMTKYLDGLETFAHYAFHEHVYSEPSVAFMFASNRAYGMFVPCTNEKLCPAHKPASGDEEDEHEHRVWEYVGSEVQPSCHLICLKGYGIIGTSPDLTETVELENSRAYSLLLLPEMPGVNVHTFYLTIRQCAVLDIAELKPDVLEELTGIPQGESIKCLLLFTRESTYFADVVMNFYTALQTRQDEKMAVAGGVFADLNGYVQDEVPLVMGVAFTGSGVSVASTVLDRNVRTEREADSLMKELKAHTVQQYNSSVGFMFACVSRGRHHYHGKRNIESAAFRKHFPKTPLFGFFGNGEIGCKVLPDISDSKKKTSGPAQENKRRRTETSVILRSYTTIMVHLAFTESHAHR